MDEIEVSLIGPGYGEAALVHVGDGKWFAIDSCVMRGDSRSAAVRYLENIGADFDKVFAVAASHWDDDHVRGLSNLVAEASTAQFIIAPVFERDEFLTYVESFDMPLTTRVRGGAKEIRNVMQVLEDTNRTHYRQAGKNRCLYGSSDLPMSHGSPIEIWSLSPADAEFTNFLARIADDIPGVKRSRLVAVSRRRNDLSTVFLVKVGDDAMLFGGDLEEEGKPTTGWTAILSLPGRPAARSSLIKISHHGSLNGDHPGIWSDLLTSTPVAVLAPFRKGSVKLPGTIDIARILKNTTDAYSTTRHPSDAPKRRSRTVDRTVKDATRSFKTVPQQPGMLRLRKKIGASTWNTEQFGYAVHLSAM